MKTLVAGALLLDFACAFTSPTAFPAGNIRPACRSVRPSTLHVVAALMPNRDLPPWLVQELPTQISEAVAGMPEDLKNRLSDIVHEKRLAEQLDEEQDVAQIPPLPPLH